ncbi:cellulose synthase operon protein YhjQ/BcsQ [Telmatobacter bradus]|uniref:cellulose synthase operon protein YhjQ/BcsQ n=1 Tax=Telmatobacter bradus TaxID=474953 RepID=UPI003B42A71B
MADQNVLPEQNQTPEDVATLYSWANLHGAKYRDFSASRAAMREKVRLQLEQAAEEEQENIRQRAEAEQARQQRQTLELINGAEKSRQEQAAAELFKRQTASQIAREEQAAQQALQQFRAAQQAVRQPQFLPQESEAVNKYSAFSPAYPQPVAAAAPSLQSSPLEAVEAQEEEDEALPAWLATERLSAATPQPAARAIPSESTLQESRERMTSRWYALQGVLHQDSSTASSVSGQQRAPVLAVFSLAGGVGKTAVAATLGRALSSSGEQVLLVDTAPYGLLPYYFGAIDQRPGQLRTFLPPGSSSDAPIQLVTLDSEANDHGEMLASEVNRLARDASRVIVDLATASAEISRKLLRLSPMVLVPLTPEMNSVVSIRAIDSFFQHNASSAAAVKPFYVLNQFDASLPLHLDMREVLREQLGERLLPFTLRRAPAISEALAEGMTVIDYAPNSMVAEDFANLAGWFKSQSAPAGSGKRGARWSER